MTAVEAIALRHLREPITLADLSAACGLCGKTWDKPKQRAAHETKAHPGFVVPPGIAEARRRQSWARANARNAGKYRARISAYMAEYRRERAEQIARTALAYDERHAPQRREASRAWKRTEAGREAKRRSEEKQRASGARTARHAVSWAITKGTLVPQPCEVCGESNVQAHHHNGYAPEHKLDVVWLCRLHHEAAHHRYARANLEFNGAFNRW